MPEIDLLRALPKTKRDIRKREDAKKAEVVAEAKRYGQMYFDGPRDCGYGGYRYDGRWVSVARDIVAHYGLDPASRVLDVGCAKGFLVKDLMSVCPGLQAYGVDVSEYALKHCEPEVVGRLAIASAERLHFPDASFDLVLSINAIHNLPRDRARTALAEIQRVSRGKAFVQVDSYHSPEEQAIFESWMLTAEFHDYPSGWLALFAEAGYTGDYAWTVIT